MMRGFHEALDFQREAKKKQTTHGNSLRYANTHYRQVTAKAAGRAASPMLPPHTFVHLDGVRVAPQAGHHLQRDAGLWDAASATSAAWQGGVYSEG